MTAVNLQSPRIGIIGTGAIGGFYGLMLARAGFDVHFLLRSEQHRARRIASASRAGLCPRCRYAAVRLAAGGHQVDR